MAIFAIASVIVQQISAAAQTAPQIFFRATAIARSVLRRVIA
jgi:hypothetical protein